MGHDRIEPPKLALKRAPQSRYSRSRFLQLTVLPTSRIGYICPGASETLFGHAFEDEQWTMFGGCHLPLRYRCKALGLFTVLPCNINRFIILRAEHYQ